MPPKKAFCNLAIAALAATTALPANAGLLMGYMLGRASCPDPVPVNVVKTGPDAAHNSYTTEIAKSGRGAIFETVNCKAGTLTYFSSDPAYKGGGVKSVTELSPVAYKTVQTNCSKDGLKAGF